MVDENETANIAEKDEKEAEKAQAEDISPTGVKINDPVRMYLKEIGRVQLLTPQKKLNWHLKLKKAIKKQNNV